LNFDVSDAVFFEPDSSSTDKLIGPQEYPITNRFYAYSKFRHVSIGSKPRKRKYYSAPEMGTGIGSLIFASEERRLFNFYPLSDLYVVPPYNREDLVNYIQETGLLGDSILSNFDFKYFHVDASDWRGRVDRWLFDNWEPGARLSAGFTKKDFQADGFQYSSSRARGPLDPDYGGYNHDLWGIEEEQGINAIRFAYEEKEDWVNQRERDIVDLCDGFIHNAGAESVLLGIEYTDISNFHYGYSFTIKEKQRG